ncbi:MAG TPA: DUF5107 domain-containing protein [Puia sp.]|nr:DUF5107 domain-containing protein [Puia sp.]
MRYLLLAILVFSISFGFAQQAGTGAIHEAGSHAATIREYQQSFPTYPFSDPSPIPLLTPVYPYFRYDGFTDKAIDKTWKVVELQNDYIRLLILPEIGGKIWAAIERSTGRPFLYYNHAVKFRDIAMRGPWTSGGLEANYGIIGHTPNCATPVDYTTRVNEDGSVSCVIGALDLLSRSYWRMEIRLPKDAALFNTRSFWYNTTALEQPYYHWMNAGLKAGDDLEFVYPGNRYLGHLGEYADWPVNRSNGKKINWYRENDFGNYKSYHVFGKYTEFSGAYWHKEELGMVRWGAHDDKAGKKIWIWGLSRQGMIWEKLLTDTDGQYVELQSGRLFNQNQEKSSLTPFKHRGFAPYGTDTWQESWYPVMGTHGFVTANPFGALNVQQENGWLKLLFSPVQSFSDTVCITVNGQAIYKKAATFRPLVLFTDSVKMGAGDFVVTIGDHHLTYESSPLAGTLARPVDAPADFNWSSAYGNYLKGCEALDQKEIPEAEAALGEALKKDPDYGPALVKMAELYYRNMRYTEALEYATRALRINTEDGGANFIYGLVNQQLGNITDARDGFDIACLDPAWRSAAYTRLAKLYLREKDVQRAGRYAEKAMVNNEHNIEALQVQAVCARKMDRLGAGSSLEGGNRGAGGGTQGPRAGEILTLIGRLDPLNHFARFEKYLADSTAANKQAFLSLIRNELPQETFLELGIWYYNNGLSADALQVFRMSPANGEIRLWIARLTGQPIDWAGIDPVRAFPFRSETGQLLEELIKKDDHWFLKYQLALIYHDRNRLAECKKLLLSCGDQPGFAPFYALRAAVLSPIPAPGSPTPDPAALTQQEAIDTQSISDLQRAVTLDPHWRYQKLLAECYIRNGQIEAALAITGKYYQAHPDQYIMGMLYARTLLLDHQFAAADKVLGRLHIIPFEGATVGRELYREAKLMQAVSYMKAHQYAKALSFIGAAKEWPENLGVGKPYEEAAEDLRLEEWMSYRCHQALHQTTAVVQPPTAVDGSKGQQGTNERVLAALGAL